MGAFQKGINNILLQAGVGAKFVSDKMQQVKDDKTAEAEKIQAEKTAEQESIKETENKINEAIQLSMGYTNKDIKARAGAEAMGINYPQKNPRGVSNKTFERRQANAETMKRILSQYVQNKDFRERISKFKPNELAGALNPQVRSKKKIGGEK